MTRAPKSSPGRDTDVTGSDVLGIDIGGANIKYADASGKSHSVDFPMWLRSDDLSRQLESDIAHFPGVSQIAVTMTGELADCFLDRAAGVTHIVQSVCRAAERLDLVPAMFYCIGSGFLSPAQTLDRSDSVAAANWHALGRFAAKEFAGDWPDGGMLIDIGSTTVDLIPIRNAAVATDSRTDFDRLAERSLVYLGGTLTPVNALMQSLRFDGSDVPVMREVFATMDDVRILLGFETPDGSDCRSADQQPRDAFHAANRMARMIGLDHRSVDIAAAAELARQVHARATKDLQIAIRSLQQKYELPADCPVVLSGHCSDLFPDAIRPRQIISLKDRWGAETSRAAPAFAVAKLFHA